MISQTARQAVSPSKMLLGGVAHNARSYRHLHRDEQRKDSTQVRDVMNPAPVAVSPNGPNDLRLWISSGRGQNMSPSDVRMRATHTVPALLPMLSPPIVLSVNRVCRVAQPAPRRRARTRNQHSRAPQPGTLKKVPFTKNSGGYRCRSPERQNQKPRARHPSSVLPGLPFSRHSHCLPGMWKAASSRLWNGTSLHPLKKEVATTTPASLSAMPGAPSRNRRQRGAH